MSVSTKPRFRFDALIEPIATAAISLFVFAGAALIVAPAVTLI